MTRTVPVDNQTAPGDVVDAVLRASQVLVGIASRSVSATNDEVTLSQYRALVVLVSQGPQRIADIAALLQVEPSTATRMSERLVRKGLIDRVGDESDKRVVQLTATRAGRDLVAAVTRKRRAEVRSVLRNMPDSSFAPLIEGLRAFIIASDDAVANGPTIGWAP